MADGTRSWIQTVLQVVATFLAAGWIAYKVNKAVAVPQAHWQVQASLTWPEWDLYRNVGSAEYEQARSADTDGKLKRLYDSGVEAFSAEYLRSLHDTGKMWEASEVCRGKRDSDLERCKAAIDAEEKGVTSLKRDGNLTVDQNLSAITNRPCETSSLRSADVATRNAAIRFVALVETMRNPALSVDNNKKLLRAAVQNCAPPAKQRGPKSKGKKT